MARDRQPARGEVLRLHLNENGRLVHYGVGASDYSTDVLAGKAIDFVASAHEPCFLYFTPIAPHLPAIPAPRPSFDERDITDKPWHAIYRRVFGTAAIHFLDRDIEGRQLRALRDLDRQVGRLVAFLERRGVLDRTVVLFASDNGFLWASTGSAARSGRTRSRSTCRSSCASPGRARGAAPTGTWC